MKGFPMKGSRLNAYFCINKGGLIHSVGEGKSNPLVVLTRSGLATSL